MFGFLKINEDLFFKELLSEDLDSAKIQKYIKKGIEIGKLYCIVKKIITY